MTTGPRTLARRTGGIVVTLLALSQGVIMSAPSAQAAYSPSAATVAAYEARVIWRMNVVRVAYHRGRLAPAACPDTYAERWGAYLARTGRFYHQSMYPILAGCRAQRVAENLARGNVSADRIVAAWMASPGHRANVLDGRLTRVGVAAVYRNGQWTVAADFSRP
ncbi:MAG: CAP domain-containing protein [Dermatophilaceae bacterium]|nr:CAP domain-containing protein [Dermatophilaceae bacterium]